MKWSRGCRAYNVESTLRMGANFVEGGSSTVSENKLFSIILCAYVYCIICACMWNIFQVQFQFISHYMTYTLH